MFAFKAIFERRQYHRVAMVGVASMLFSTAALAQGTGIVNTEADSALQRKMERTIQKCIRDKAASPYICRASAYATALSQGYSPERAAYLTKFKRR